MNFKKFDFKILNDEYFFYSIFILCCLYILGHISMNNTNVLFLFSLVAIITTFFTKNLSIILTTSLIISLIFTSFMACFNLMKTKEGMEGSIDEKEKQTKLMTSTSLPPVEDQNNTTNQDNETNVENTESLTSFKKNGNKKESYIDLASTLEESYDNLNDILGKEGISKLTTDTTKLMKEQQKLFESMKSMAPLVNEAKKMVEGMNIGDLNSIVKSASSFITPQNK